MIYLPLFKGKRQTPGLYSGFSKSCDRVSRSCNTGVATKMTSITGLGQTTASPMWTNTIF